MISSGYQTDWLAWHVVPGAMLPLPLSVEHIVKEISEFIVSPGISSFIILILNTWSAVLAGFLTDDVMWREEQMNGPVDNSFLNSMATNNYLLWSDFDTLDNSSPLQGSSFK